MYIGHICWVRCIYVGYLDIYWEQVVIQRTCHVTQHICGFTYMLGDNVGCTLGMHVGSMVHICWVTMSRIVEFEHLKLSKQEIPLN